MDYSTRRTVYNTDADPQRARLFWREQDAKGAVSMMRRGQVVPVCLWYGPHNPGLQDSIA